MRPTRAVTAALLVAAAACSSRPNRRRAGGRRRRAAAADPQHQNVVGPHGDHTPHKGGMVLMNGDIHYEVVLSREGQHRIWFSDAVRAELPASVATGVTHDHHPAGRARRGAGAGHRRQRRVVDGRGRPVTGDDAYVKINYALQGEPHEVELPFVPATAPRHRNADAGAHRRQCAGRRGLRIVCRAELQLCLEAALKNCPTPRTVNRRGERLFPAEHPRRQRRRQHEERHRQHGDVGRSGASQPSPCQMPRSSDTA